MFFLIAVFEENIIMASDLKVNFIATDEREKVIRILDPKATVQRCSSGKVFLKYASNLQ